MQTNDFVESYFNAWNVHDPVAVADHLASNGIYRDIPENVQRNHDELIISLDRFFHQFRHRYELIGTPLTSPGSLAFQYRMYPDSTAINGRGSKSYRGAEFMSLDGEAALSIVDYYDVPGSAIPPSSAGLAHRHPGKSKYAKSGLSHEQLSLYKQQLEQAMRAEKAYLQLDLTLPKLARDIGCSVNHLSQVINSGFGMSFFEYVNQFRVEHAKTLLADPNSRRDAVLNIAFTVGFNSNSAFYAAFKKFVGQTPAQYRKARST